MKPDALIAAKTFRRVRKIGTRPPKRLPPPASFSIPRPNPKIWRSRRLPPPTPRPAEAELPPQKSKPGQIRPGFIYFEEAPIPKGENLYREIGGAGGPALFVPIGEEFPI